MTTQPEFRLGLDRARERSLALDEATIERRFHAGYTVGWEEALDLAMEVPRGFSEKGCAIALAEIATVRPFPPPLPAHLVCDVRFISLHARFRGPRFIAMRPTFREGQDVFDVGYEFGFRRGVRETDLTNAARRRARDACVAVLIEENEAWPLPMEQCTARCEAGADESVLSPW